jgi:Fur family transcriptional regulator, ferric uptake regulator
MGIMVNRSIEVTWMDKDAAVILRERGLKHTAGREALLELMFASGKPLSHRELCRILEPLQYDPVSVYRSLDSFIAAGIVHRIEDDNRTWLYALCTCGRGNHCHPHFFCRSCGKCECLKEVAMPEITGLQGTYVIEEKRYYVKGLCAACAAVD